MILNRPSEGLLSVLLVLRKAIVAFGPMPTERLLALVAPASATDEEPTKGAAAKTLNRWVQLGFFNREGGIVSLASPFDGPTATIEDLRTELLKLVLAGQNNADLHEGAGDRTSSGASDFTRAVAWALMQDPYELSAEPDLERFARSQLVAPDIFTNDTRRLGFDDWAHFLGFALPIGSGRTINPARAIRPHVQEILKHNKEVPVRQFVALLAEAVPVIDRGTYWLAVLKQTTKPRRLLESQEVSPCLTLGLRQLEHEGSLYIHKRSDAQEQMVLLGRKDRPLQTVTHVSRGDA